MFIFCDLLYVIVTMSLDVLAQVATETLEREPIQKVSYINFLGNESLHIKYGELLLYLQILWYSGKRRENQIESKVVFINGY